MSLFKEGDAGGEPVDEVLTADGAKLSLGEEAGQWHLSDFGVKDAGIVIRLWK